MKITIEIGGNDYTFEMNRATYKKMLADEEYSKIQNEISKKIKEKKLKDEIKDEKTLKAEIEKELTNDEDISAVRLRNMVFQEQIFCHSLSINHPELSWDNRIKLIDTAYEEYGEEQVIELCTKLTENFTQSGSEPKKKMTMKIS